MDVYDEIVHSIPMTVSIPHRNELCCVTCEISLSEVQDSSAKSNFHWQTMKCRLLIFQLCEVIAAPAPIINKHFPFYPQCKHEEEPMYISVVCTKEFFETGLLQSYFERYNLAYGSPQPVTIETYKSCLNYTIQCKTAPEWIRIGRNLIRDIIFSDSTHNLDAIQLNISIEGDCGTQRTRFDFLARTTTIPFLNIEDFYFPCELLAEFNADPKGRIDFTQPYYAQFSRWVHVLPSMKRGKIVSVSKEMSNDCPFKDYEHLRRHWRNMYGYRLPKTPENILFYEVCFPVPSQRNTPFTYPNCCLITKPLEFHAHVNSDNVVTQFTQSVLEHLAKVCDKKLEISKLLATTPRTPMTVKTPSLNIKGVERVSLPRHMFTIMSNTPSSKEVTPKMEFSTKFPNPLLKADVAQVPRLTPLLSVIQQVHSASTSAGVSCNKIEEKNVAKSSIPATEDRDISNYFKELKPRPKPYDKTTQTLSLREKILSNMSTKSDSFSLMNENCIEKMAKEGKLQNARNDVLKHWLRERSIPYRAHDRKSDLINKITSHMKNTRPLDTDTSLKNV